jgi:hypothetical protein
MPDPHETAAARADHIAGMPDNLNLLAATTRDPLTGGYQSDLIPLATPKRETCIPPERLRLARDVIDDLASDPTVDMSALAHILDALERRILRVDPPTRGHYVAF